MKSTDPVKKNVKNSKFLSLVLRHKPEKIEIELDENGWANVKELLKKTGFDFETLEEIVLTNDKQRFSFNEDKTKVRANQGHSIDIDLQLKPTKPPDILYHGTIKRFLNSIMHEGLKKGSRQFVHLSMDSETARKVGSRRGKSIILMVNSRMMHEQGYKFFISENNVWLTDNVPFEFIM